MKNNEEYFALFGRRFGNLWLAYGNFYREDSPAHVDFDYEEIYRREDESHSLIGFYHTHPHWLAIPSSVDVPTMRSWVSAIGRPLHCIIEGTDGTRDWVFDVDDVYSNRSSVYRIGNLFFGRCYNKIG